MSAFSWPPQGALDLVTVDIAEKSPEAPDFEPQNERVEKKLTEDQAQPNQFIEANRLGHAYFPFHCETLRSGVRGV